MLNTFRAAAIQMNSGDDKQANLQTATQLITAAAEQGAQLIALPEMFNCWGRLETIVAHAETIPGPTSECLANLARRLRITLVGGSLAERAADGQRAYNTCVVFGPDGQELARYRKQHLFDVNLPGQTPQRESQWIAPGAQTVTVDTEFGKLGLAICYDLRFAAQFDALARQGAEIIVIPSAFMHTTGLAHWEVLLRARAIETQCYVIAPNQYGSAANITTYGHSLLVDPWGNVLADAGAERAGIASAEISHALIDEIRARIPVTQYRA